jgi:ferredoxin
LSGKLSLIRRIVAAVFLFSFLLLFLDFFCITSSAFKKYFLQLQFLPSLLNFISTATVLSAGFVLIILLTLLTGRLYCSAICPLGIIQDIVIRCKSFFEKKKNRYRPHPNMRILRYAVVLVCAASIPLGFMIAINLLDPFSIAGKMTVAFLKPPVVLLNNMLSGLLAAFRNYSIAPIELKLMPLSSYLITLALTAIVIGLSIYKERIFCNTLCPVGGFLGLLSRYALVKFRIDHAACKSCGVCEWVCKAGCINSDTQTIDAERCVVCFNCVTACPTGVIYFKNDRAAAGTRNITMMEGGSRRTFLTLLIGAASLGFLQKKPVNVYKENTVPVKRKNAVSPPGSISLRRFADTCTACQLCVSHCPTLVLQPSISDYGWDGIMQATLDFRYGFCNYECTVCVDVCPTGALLPLSKENKKLTQLGKVKFIKENCVVETQGTECGACSEHCPTKAVRMVPYKKIHIPETRDNICIGCGACEYACPTKPYKAIYIEGNAIHAIAEKPAEEPKQKKTEVPEEFPF